MGDERDQWPGPPGAVAADFFVRAKINGKICRFLRVESCGALRFTVFRDGEISAQKIKVNSREAENGDVEGSTKR